MSEPAPTDKTHRPNENFSRFHRRTWTVVGVVTLVLIVLLILYKVFNVLLLLLTATLISIFFRALAGRIRMWTGWKDGISLTVAILATVLILSAMSWLIGAKLSSQANELTQALPDMVENAKTYLGKSQIGTWILERLNQSGEAGAETPNVVPFVQKFFQSTFGVLGDIYVVFILSLFLAASPRVYVNGFINMLPRRSKPSAKVLFENLGDNLKLWLKGALIAGMVIFVLSGIGLLVMGVKIWLILALIAGTLNIIPNFGPLIALIPAVLVGLADSPMKALAIAILFTVVQALESTVITPQIQRKMLSIPPALLFFFQIIMATLVGGWGIVLATPLLVILMTVIKHLYLKEESNERVNNEVRERKEEELEAALGTD